MSECLGDQAMVDLVEGRVSDDERARIEAHASRCDECRAVLSSLARSEKPAARPSKLEIGAKIDRYLVKRMLGSGGMGMVYAAHDPELDRGVAIKLLRPDVGGPEAQERMAGRLKREAQAMAQLAHPNVVAVYDVGDYGDRIFVAMEYIDGETLHHWLAQKARTHAEILDAFAAAGRGLAAAHAEGLVHRDFKPENCVVGDDGRVRVLDFGLALSVGEGSQRTPLPLIIAHAIEAAGASTPLDLTRTGTVIGTPYYMSPEQYRGEDADARTDQFSFCVALYSALYEQRPFRGDTFETLAEAVLAGKVAAIPKGTRVKPHVRAAIARGMAHEPADRYPTMDALLADLSTPPKRSRLVWIAPAVVGAVALSAGIVYATRAPAVVVPPSAKCLDLATQLGETWNDARRSKLRATFGKLAPGLGASHDKTIALGEAYATSWEAARSAACSAEQAGTPSGAILACLSTRLRALGEATRILGEDNVDYTAAAIHVMRALPAIDACALVDESIGDPAAARRATELRQRIAEIEVQLSTGDVDRASKSNAPLLVDAALADPVLQAEVNDLAVRIQDARTVSGLLPPTSILPTDTASRQLDIVGKLLDDDRATRAIRARIAVDRVVHDVKIGRPFDAWWLREDTLAAIADAETAKAITPAAARALRGAMLLRYGETKAWAHHTDEAHDDFEAALAAFGDDPELRARVLLAYARLDQRLRDAGAARAHVAQAIAALSDAFGSSHPEVGAAIVELAILERDAGNADAALSEITRAGELYANGFGLANRWRGAALTLQAELTPDRDAAIALLEEVDRIDDALGYHDMLATSNQYRLAIAYLPTDREKAFRTLSRPPRNLPPPGVTPTGPQLPSRAYARPLRQAYVEAMERATIQMEFAYARVGEPPPPPPAPGVPFLPSSGMLFTMAKSSVESARNSRGSAFFASKSFSIDLDNSWREDYLAGEIELGAGRAASAVPLLAKSVRFVPGDDAVVANVEAAYGRALVDAKTDVAKGRALVIAAYPRMTDAYARERTRIWMTAHAIP